MYARISKKIDWIQDQITKCNKRTRVVCVLCQSFRRFYLLISALDFTHLQFDFSYSMAQTSPDEDTKRGYRYLAKLVKNSRGDTESLCGSSTLINPNVLLTSASVASDCYPCEATRDKNCTYDKTQRTRIEYNRRDPEELNFNRRELQNKNNKCTEKMVKLNKNGCGGRNGGGGNSVFFVERHPSFDNKTLSNDFAIICLQESVTGVKTLDMNYNIEVPPAKDDTLQAIGWLPGATNKTSTPKIVNVLQTKCSGGGGNNTLCAAIPEKENSCNGNDDLGMYLYSA